MEQQSLKTAYSISATELAERGFSDIPDELVSSKHLIYSSPATLSFNSPGAQGFGVKRAGLAIPGSVMLLVAPACCGRNTTMLSQWGGYADRFYYLLQDNTDIVTGRHLEKIPQAVKEIVEYHDQRPSCVMICITCVDALLGTDMERVCEKSSKVAGVPVLPCYMFALTREGKLPPMTAVRRTVYQLLEKRKKDSRAVNILGEFAPFHDSCELYEILKSLGIKTIREISRCKSFEDYLEMAEANFNIVLNPLSRLAAQDLYERLEIPSIELTRQYRISKIHKQYRLFAQALACEIDDSIYMKKAEEALKHFKATHPDLQISIGECLNGDPFEMAIAFSEAGFKVKEIFGTVSRENFAYIKLLAAVSPETRIFTNLSPSMINYDCSEAESDITIGKDAEYYHPGVPNVPWNQETQPFGYDGLIRLLNEMEEALS